MQLYVQKLTSTTFRSSVVAFWRGELSHSLARPMAANSRDSRLCASAVPVSPKPRSGEARLVTPKPRRGEGGAKMPNCAAAIVIAAPPRKRRRSRSSFSATCQCLTDPRNPQPLHHIRQATLRLSDDGIDVTFLSHPIPRSDRRLHVARAFFVAATSRWTRRSS